MPAPVVILPIAWALMTFLRVANKQRRNGQNRRRLRRYFALINLFTSGRALTYCRMDRNVPILRLWFDVELELIRDFRLNGVVGALGPGGEEVDGPARVAGIGVGGAVSAVVEDGSGSSMGGSTMA
uniref:Secreted protein n=1 Tax=Knipowitschia caucasica TaxID=637954 RepID=A0AAV2L1E3_KNICA